MANLRVTEPEPDDRRGGLADRHAPRDDQGWPLLDYALVPPGQPTPERVVWTTDDGAHVVQAPPKEEQP